jgi:hypothetical protein
VRLPEFRRLVGHSRSDAPGALTVLRAALSGDEHQLEAVATARSRAQQRRARDAQRRAEEEAERERRRSLAKFIEDECRKNGAWFPSDWR